MINFFSLARSRSHLGGSSVTLSTPTAESRSWGLPLKTSHGCGNGSSTSAGRPGHSSDPIYTGTTCSLKVASGVQRCSMEPSFQPFCLHFPTFEIMDVNYSAHLISEALKFLSQCLTLALNWSVSRRKGYGKARTM